MCKCEAINPNVRGNNKILFKDEIMYEYPHKWDKSVLTYKLHNFSPDITKQYHQIRAVTVAFRVWQLRIKDLRFKREYGNDTADINIYFRPPEVFSSNNVFAHAWYPKTSREGDVEFNDAWDWVTHSAVQDIGHPPIVPIMIHELGHTLGLSHDVIEKGSIMWPSFNLGKKKNDLGPRDVTRIQDRYGKRSISQRLIDYFKRRRDIGSDFR